MQVSRGVCVHTSCIFSRRATKSPKALALAGVAQQCRGVRRCGEQSSALFRPLPMFFHHAEIWPNQALGGNAAKAYNNFWPYQAKLFPQIRHTGLPFLRRGVPVFPAGGIYDVGDKMSSRFRWMAARYLSSSWPLRPTKEALLVFCAPGRLANEHYLGVRAAHAKHHMGAGLAQPFWQERHVACKVLKSIVYSFVCCVVCARETVRLGGQRRRGIAAAHGKRLAAPSEKAVCPLECGRCKRKETGFPIYSAVITFKTL